MKPNNNHSKKVWNIFVTKAGTDMASWNLTGWNPIDEDTVMFTLEKPNFYGTITVTELKEGGLFFVSFRHFSWFFVPVTTLTDVELVDFLNKLGNEYGSVSNEPVVGQRAPKD